MEIEGPAWLRVVDELEIRKLVARYADAVTHIDGQAWIETWAEDGRWTIGGATSEGHAKLLETWQVLMSLFEKVVQLPQHGLLELRGDRATGRWGVIELGRTRGGSPSFTVGAYHDVYRRVETRWCFSERRFEAIYTGAPDLDGPWLG
ncbi:MAG: nuclear transport factor 2 family protein [Deltaproteobacteria bacterium]|nr:MAG: nuclear transport factor 2 family protein [Deltaproteobacteria bacterium]